MAMKVKVLGENGQSIGTYHRIAKLEYDFDIGQVHIRIDHYANESYRNKEKAQKQDIKSKKERYEELNNKTNLTDEEKMELAVLDPQQIEGMQISKTCICSSKYTFFTEDEVKTVREIYEQLTANVRPFANAEEV